MKNNAKKRSFRKSLIPALSIFMIIVAVLLLVYTIDSKKFNKGRVTHDSKYAMRVLYLVMNEDEVPKDITMSKTFDPNYSEYPEGILASVGSIVPLTKKGEYLYVDLDNFTNPELLKKETDYVFAMMNNNGEVIDGCEYNTKTNIIKVPISYFENNKSMPIQMEVQTLMKKDTFDNLSTTVNVKKFITKKVKTINNGLDVDTSVYIGKFGISDLDNKDVHVYINNSDVELDNKLYEVKDGRLTVFFNSILINKLDVKVDYTISKAKAAISDRQTNLNNIRGIHLSGPLSLPTGQKTITMRVGYTYGTPQVPAGELQYCDYDHDTTNCMPHGGFSIFNMSGASWSYTYFEFPAGSGTYETYTPYSKVEGIDYSDGSYQVLFTYRADVNTLIQKFDPNLTGTIDSIHPSRSESSQYIGFFCVEATDQSRIYAGDNMTFDVNVVATSDRSITLKFTSPNQFNNQSASAYLRFYWDNTAGLNIVKTVSPGIPVRGLPITIISKDNPNVRYTETTNVEGVAHFEGLVDGSKYVVSEGCNAPGINLYYPANSSTPCGTPEQCHITCQTGEIGRDANNKEFIAGPLDNNNLYPIYNVVNQVITGGLTVKKQDDSGEPIENVTITIRYRYDHSQSRTGRTGPDGKVTFENLTVDPDHPYEFEIIESCSDTNVGYKGRTGSLADLGLSCDYGEDNPYPHQGQSYATPSYKINDAYNLYYVTNSHVPVGLKIRKTDEDGIPIEHLKISLYNIGADAVVRQEYTNANGIAEFGNLTRGARYKVLEDCDSTINYNGHQNTTLEAQDIECTYDANNMYPSDPAYLEPIEDYDNDDNAFHLTNVKYRHCTVAKKVKGPLNRPEKNILFTLHLNAGTCRQYGNHNAHIDALTNDSGYATWVYLGNCVPNATGRVEIDPTLVSSVDGPNTQQVSFVRSVTKVTKDGGLTYKGRTYVKGARINIAFADWEANKNYVEETCPTGSAVEFHDKGLILLWTKVNKSHKVNNADKKMNNVRFTVKDKNNVVQTFDAKASYSDLDGTTKSCYVWNKNGNGSVTELVSDSNGEVCVSNLPLPASGSYTNVDITYTISEVATDYYLNSPMQIVAGERFSEFTNKIYTNNEYLIDWSKKEYKNDKTFNSNKQLSGAQFSVTGPNNTVVKTKDAKETVYDQNGVAKSCYVVDLDNNANNTRQVFESDNSGYACIIGLKKSTTYTITETAPPTGYAYGNNKSFTQTSKLTFTTPSVFNNCPTEVKVTKNTTELANASNDYKKLVYEELQKLTFNVVDESNNVVKFVYNTTSKHYEEASAIERLTGTYPSNATAEVRLLVGVNVPNTDLSNMNLDMYFNYLPAGNYRLVESSSIKCGTTQNGSNSGSNCQCMNNYQQDGNHTQEESACANMGYAAISPIPFRVTENNNSVYCDKAENATKISVLNKPTEIKFTKKDFYGYFVDDEVKFENDEEVRAFDNITFRVRKQSTVTGDPISEADSNFEWFYKTSNGNYRYDVLHKCSSEGQRVGGYTCTRNLHTNNGNMNIKHLCKCETYYIEEYEVPDGSVFILPKLEGDTCGNGYMKVNKNNKLECHPYKSIKICDCDDDDPSSSPPVLIEDKPTKQVFIKKDLKYNTIITDQTVRFEVFLTTEAAANAGRKCNPYDATSKANDCIQMYFEEFEDPDEPLAHTRAYRMVQDATTNRNKVSSLKLDQTTGKLILRYLPSYISREYVLMETVAPKGYDLPVGENSVTRFKVVNDTINVDITNVPNKPSKVIVSKYDKATGKLIAGVKFRLYKVNNYDPNLSPMAQSLNGPLRFRTIKDGAYEYREKFDTDEIITCLGTDDECSIIEDTLVDENFEENNLDEGVTIKHGQALIQYLDTDTYYVLEEYKVPDGYKMPERESDRYTLFKIEESDNGMSVETKIYNTENYFVFYKFDEFNKPIDGAEFKLQKLNKNKVYEDVPLVDMSTEDTKIYKVDSTSDNYTMTTLNGQATIYRLTEGQYRILETKAPEGYELPKKTYNVATFLVDQNGNTYGSNIIANKKQTKRIEIVPTSEAEFIINIQTGQTIVKYGLIITGILGLIGLLIFIRKKISK